MYIKHTKLQIKQLKLAQYYLPCPLWIIFFTLFEAWTELAKHLWTYTELFVSVFDHYETLRGATLSFHVMV